MSVPYESYLDRLQAAATVGGLDDLRLGREEFHNKTGKFSDGEPWFELRMQMFLDWYLLDREGQGGMTPAARYLVREGHEMPAEEREQLVHLTTSFRSVFRALAVRGDDLLLEDLIRGGLWQARCTIPRVGLGKGDILGTRVVYFDGQLTMGRGTVLHPREVHETIHEIAARGRRESAPTGDMVHWFDMMKLKLDRYSSVRIGHIYRYPTDAQL